MPPTSSQSTAHESDKTIMPSTSSSSLVHDGPAVKTRIMIAVMGQTGVGKTTFVNMASGSKLATSDGLDSCTTKVQVSKEFELDGRLVTLIDTPGFDDSDKSDVDVLEMIAEFLVERYKEKRKLAGVIYVHRISDNRISGTSKRNFDMFRELCGENAFRNVIIATTMWGKVGREEGENREKGLRNKDGFFKDVLEKGAKMVRHEHVRSTSEILRLIIANHHVPLLIQQELVDQKKQLAETAAGQEVRRELIKKAKNYERTKTNKLQELQVAIRNKDVKRKRELQQEIEEDEWRQLKVEEEWKKLNTKKIWWVLGYVALAVAAVAVAPMLAGAVTAEKAVVAGLAGRKIVVNVARAK